VERPVAEPTPRPWRRCDADPYDIEADGRGLLVTVYPEHFGERNLGAVDPDRALRSFAEADANAALIVRAVNVHEELIAALRGALVVIDTLPWPTEAEAGSKVLAALTKRRSAIVAALAKAGAGQ